MNAFVQLKPEDRRTAFVQAAAATQLSPEVVEKDFWVCWTLKELFALPAIGAHLIFKGGTSLSKVFKVIERFSEDIDVSIDRASLGFGGVNEPEAGASNKEKQRRIEALKTACQQKIAQELMPALEAGHQAKDAPGREVALRPDADDPDQQTLLFDYPTSYTAGRGWLRPADGEDRDGGTGGSLAERDEDRSRPTWRRNSRRRFKKPSCTVKVLSAERTFWEKATILHAEFHRPADKPMPERFSRHYCDFFELIRKGVGDVGDGKIGLAGARGRSTRACSSRLVGRAMARRRRAHCESCRRSIG